MFVVAICLFFRKTKLSVLVACNKLQTESTNAAAIYKTKNFPSAVANNNNNNNNKKCCQTIKD